MDAGNCCNTLIAVYADKCYTLKDGESEWVHQITTIGKSLPYSSGCMLQDGSILITGGSTNKQGYVNHCWKLDIRQMEWCTLPGLNLEHDSHATVCMGDQVYVLGGTFCKEILSDVEYLDRETGFWQFTSDMPMGLYGHTAVAYKHFIYVFGGVFSKATFMLDTISKVWRKKADMPSGSNWGCAVVYRDRIYVMSSRFMSYDPDNDKWATPSQPALEESRRSAVVWKDRILLCGAENSSVIEEYDPDRNTWAEWKHRLPRAAERRPIMFVVHM